MNERKLIGEKFDRIRWSFFVNLSREWESVVGRRNLMLGNEKTTLCFDFAFVDKKKMKWSQWVGRKQTKKVDSFSCLGWTPVGRPKQTEKQKYWKNVYWVTSRFASRYMTQLQWRGNERIHFCFFFSIFFPDDTKFNAHLDSERRYSNWSPVEKK